MFGDVYSNRGFAGELRGSSPGGASSLEIDAPVVLRVGQDGDTRGGSPGSGTRRTDDVRVGVSSCVATAGKRSEDVLPRGGSRRASALLRDDGTSDREKQPVSRHGSDSFGANEFQRAETESTSPRPQIDPHTGPYRGTAPGTSETGETPRQNAPRNDLLFRRAPLLGRGHSQTQRGAQFAFDPWTKLPVRVVNQRSEDDDAGTSPREFWRLKWCWRVRSASWWVALCYLLGSIGFAVGGLASCFSFVVRSKSLYFHWQVLPYTAGGISFLVATLLLVFTSYSARYGEPGRADRKAVARRHAFLGGGGGAKRGKRGRRALSSGVNTYLDEGSSAEQDVGRLPDGFWHLRAAVGEPGLIGDSIVQPLMDDERSEVLNLSDAMEEARRLWLANDSWTRRRRALELVSSGLILLGVVLYKVMVFTMFGRCVFGEFLGTWTSDKEFLLYTLPSILGSCFFVVGSHVLWCAVNRSWRPPFLPQNTPTWIAWLSVLGSVLYLIGSLAPVLPTWAVDFSKSNSSIDGHSMDHTTNHTSISTPLEEAHLNPTWPFLFSGFFLGSLVFALQSLLMIHEIAESGGAGEAFVGEEV